MKITKEKIQQIKEDPELFVLIYEKYVREIGAYTYYLCRNKHGAEDLTSMTFMRALEKISKFDAEKGNIRAWIYRIAHNIFIDEVRKNKHQTTSLEPYMEGEDSENLENKITDLVMHEKVLKRLEELEPPIYAQVLILRYKKEFSIKEIAVIIGKSETNVTTLISRAMKKLRESQY